MTWKEFKEAVESHGITDETVLDCVDWSGWCDEVEVEISTLKDGRLYGAIFG